MNLIFEYSPWYLLPILALSVFGAYLAYKPSIFTQDWPPYLKWLVPGLRAFSFFLLGLLLLNPVFKSTNQQVEKPKLVLLADNSRSMTKSKDSLQLQQQMARIKAKLEQELGEEYSLESFAAGNELQDFDSLNFSAESSDHGAWLDQVHKQFIGQNLGALIMATDGIQNKGESPLNKQAEKRAPVYTIAFGDTAQKKDAFIADVRANKSAIKNTSFPVVLSLGARQLQGEKTVLEVKEGDQVLFSTATIFNSSFWNKEISIALKADKPGLHKYVAQLKPLNGEFTDKNNKLNFYVDVKESNDSVVLLYTQVHPDISALASAVQNMENYHFSARSLSDPVVDLRMAKLFIFQINGVLQNAQKDQIRNYLKLGVPVLWMLGPNVDRGFINGLSLGLNISGANGQNLVQARFNENFQSFSTSFFTESDWLNLPPLAAPFGDVNLNGAFQILAYQQLGRLKTELPLLALGESNGRRMGFWFGEGLWRWKMSIYQEYLSHDAFYTFIDQQIKYLCAVERDNPLQVNALRRYQEGNPINLSASLRDESNQWIAQKEIKLELVYNDSLKYDYLFNPTANGYELDLGNLPAGVYGYSASCSHNQKKYTYRGSFIVEDLNLEEVQTVANHQFLNQISKNGGAISVGPGDIDQLINHLKNNQQIKPVLYEQTQITGLIQWKSICFVLLICLALEWWLRKRNGLK